MRERLGVDTTPQTFIDGELVGTLDDLREYLGEDVPDDSKTYRPVVTLFAVTLLMAFGAASVVEEQPHPRLLQRRRQFWGGPELIPESRRVGYDLNTIAGWLRVFFQRVLRRPVQAVDVAERPEDRFGRVAVAAWRLAGAERCQRGCVAGRARCLPRRPFAWKA